LETGILIETDEDLSDVELQKLQFAALGDVGMSLEDEVDFVALDGQQLSPLNYLGESKVHERIKAAAWDVLKSLEATLPQPVFLHLPYNLLVSILDPHLQHLATSLRLDCLSGCALVQHLCEVEVFRCLEGMDGIGVGIEDDCCAFDEFINVAWIFAFIYDELIMKYY
jgi:hypothetical protein